MDHQEPRPKATGTGRAFDSLCHRLAGPPARPHGGATSARQPRTASCKSPEIVHKPSPGAVTPGWVPGLTRSTSSTKPAPTRPALISAKSGKSLYPLAITSRFNSSTTRRRFHHDTKSLSLVSLGPATSSGSLPLFNPSTRSTRFTHSPPISPSVSPLHTFPFSPCTLAPARKPDGPFTRIPFTPLRSLGRMTPSLYTTALGPLCHRTFDHFTSRPLRSGRVPAPAPCFGRPGPLHITSPPFRPGPCARALLRLARTPTLSRPLRAGRVPAPAP